MRDLIIGLTVGTIAITLLVTLLFGNHQITASVGGSCIIITIITAFLAKRAFKNTKGMEDL